MAVPPPSLTISCWQSLQERRSPAFSRVRAASASSTARWPGEERKERGRWRQASRMAVARSRWLGQASASPAGTRGACGHRAEPAGPRALPRGLHVDAFARPLHRPARQVPAPSRGQGRGGDKNVAGITRLVFRGGGEMRPLALALGPVLPPWLLPWGVPGPTPTRPHSAPSWATRLVEPWPPLLPTALPGWAGPARGLRAGALGDSPGLAFWVPRRRRLCSSSWWVRVGLAPAIRRTVASCRNTWGGAAETRSSPGAPPVCPSPHRCLSLQQLICHLTPALPSTAPRPAYHRCSPTPDTEWERGTGSGL